MDKLTDKLCCKRQSDELCGTWCPLCAYVPEIIQKYNAGAINIIPNDKKTSDHFIVYCGCQPVRIEIQDTTEKGN